METISIILAANLFTFYFITQSRLNEKWKLNFKPFNCPLCLTAWVGLLLFLLPNIVTSGVLAMFGSGVLAPYVKNFLINIYNYKL
jgi:hypothetical protein